jgi:EF hand domain-containing protein
MLTKMKIALAVCGSLVAGGVGLAAAQGFNGSGGKLDDQERAAMRADRQAHRQEMKAKMLAKYDTNHDGKLDPQERAAMREDRAEKAFKRLDTNGDGQLSFQEFKLARPFQGRGGHGRHMRGRMGGQMGGNGSAPAGTGGQP